MEKEKDEERVIIYTDGACFGNPGPGGWAALLTFKNTQKEISGGDGFTTNNRMEMMAVIEALKLLKRPCRVEVRTDSQYVKKGITEWFDTWKENGWKNSQKEEIKNKELWQELGKLTKEHGIEWTWVKGHANDALNNRVDFLAKKVVKEKVLLLRKELDGNEE